MGWRIVSVTNLPLGLRKLAYGAQGSDVRKLQELLSQAGVYFGTVDGIYGVLTEEAVTLFQQEFGLRVDGIVGPEVLRRLKNSSRQSGRIIYLVKPHENLESISRRFAVKKTAWQRIPGQGNPHRKIYPGLRMLLPEKALLIIGNNLERCVNAPMNTTGCLIPGWQMMPDGSMEQKGVDTSQAGAYQSWGAVPEVWPELILNKKYFGNFVNQIKRNCGNQLVIDLRNAPLETMFQWAEFLKNLCRALSLPILPLVLIPLWLTPALERNRLYWENYVSIGKFAKLILIKPILELSDPEAMVKSAGELKRSLKRLVKLNLANKLLLSEGVTAWDWNLDQVSLRTMAYPHAKFLRALHPLSHCYSAETTFTKMDYLSRHERHCLVYRDENGWLELFRWVIQLNLLGMAMENFADLGKLGSELCASTFAILPSEKLWY